MIQMYLSLLEQSPRTRTIYTQLCFCFTTTKPISHDGIVEVLSNGLRRLTSSFPWLAGRVTYRDSDLYEPYPIRVEQLAEVPLLVVRDHTGDEAVPDMKTMIESRFPYSMLDEKSFCSRSTLSEWANEDQSYPVLLLQANFINGGLLLTVQACHSVMDIVGEAQVIRMLSKACHDEDPTVQELTSGNMDRRDIVTLLQDVEVNRGPESTKGETTVVTDKTKEIINPPSPSLVWSYFAFSSGSLTRLKAAAQAELPKDSSFVSTDDCVSALIWQSVARSRFNRLDYTTPLSFIRQVDVRRHMNVSDTYLGNMVGQTKTVESILDLCDKSLGILASTIRGELDPNVLRHQVRVQATNQATGSKQIGGGKDRVNTITMSSWSKVDLQDLDFNLGFGKPVAIRRPRFTPTEGVVYLLPRATDGEVLAGLCLRCEDMDRLRQDPKFTEYADYIG